MNIGWYLGLLKGILTVRVLRRPVPLMAHWEITYRCNLNCSFCGSRLNPTAWGKETSTAEAERVLDQLSALGTRVLNIVGGEPTLRADLGHLLRYARQRGLRTAVTTNGVVDDAKREQLLEADILRISMEGAPALNNDLRASPPGVDPSAQAIETLEYLVAHGKSPAISTTLSHRTADHDIAFLTDLCRRLGIRMGIVPVDGFSFGDMSQGFDQADAREREKKRDPNQLSREEGLKRIGQYRARYPDIIVSGEPGETVLRRGGLEKYGCLAMTTALSLKPDGSAVLPCIEFPHRVMQTRDLAAVFYGPEADAARRRQGRYWFCQNCQLFCMIYAGSLVRLGPLIDIARGFLPQVLPRRRPPPS